MFVSLCPSYMINRVLTGIWFEPNYFILKKFEHMAQIYWHTWKKTKEITPQLGWNLTLFHNQNTPTASGNLNQRAQSATPRWQPLPWNSHPKLAIGDANFCMADLNLFVIMKGLREALGNSYLTSLFFFFLGENLVA